MNASHMGEATTLPALLGGFRAKTLSEGHPPSKEGGQLARMLVEPCFACKVNNP